jgi:uncharacterized protein YjbJ (UPF0337 family)
MNSDELQGKWKQLKGAARQQFGKLTDDDVEMIAGQRDRLIGKLQERYGYLREEAQKKADEFLASAKSTTGAPEQRQHDQRQHMPPPATSQQQGSQEHAHKR